MAAYENATLLVRQCSVAKHLGADVAVYDPVALCSPRDRDAEAEIPGEEILRDHRLPGAADRVVVSVPGDPQAASAVRQCGHAIGRDADDVGVNRDPAGLAS